MSCFRRVLVLGALGLAACHAPVVAPKPSPKAGKAVTVEATPAAPAAKATPTPAPSPLAALQPPAGSYVALSGTVKVDAGYLVGNNAGNLVGDNRLAVGDATILANNAGNLVASREGGSARSNADGSFVAAGNAGIVANNGGGLISDHGGGIVANNGGGIIANHGSGRRLLALPAAGTLLPAGGLVVSAVSLRDHQYVPLGADAAGQPVYAIYSDAAGGYKLYLPQALEGNVAVVAGVPQSADARLVYNAIAPIQANTTAPVDDDAAATARMIRRALAGQIGLIITAADNATNVHAIVQDGTVPDAFKEPLTRVVTQLNQRAHERGVPTDAAALDVPAVRELAGRLADVVLGYMAYDDMKLDPVLVPDWQGPQDKLFVAIGAVFAHLREVTAAYLQTKPLPTRLSYSAALQAPGGSADCYFEDIVPLATPADADLYVVDDLLARSQANGFYNTGRFFRALATKPDEDPDVFFDAAHRPFEEHVRLRACTSVLFAHFALTLAPDDSPAFAAMLKALDDFAAANPLTGAPSPRPRIGQGVPCTPKAP